MRAKYLTIAGVLFTASVGFSLQGVRPLPSEAQGTADVVPLVQVESGGQAPLSIVFENVSKEALRYIPAADGRSVNRLRFILSRDGQQVVPIRQPGQVSLTASRVRELQPGGVLVHNLSLREMYGDLKPGRYLLEGEIDGQPTDFNLTQIHLKRKILYIDVIARNAE